MMALKISLLSNMAIWGRYLCYVWRVHPFYNKLWYYQMLLAPALTRPLLEHVIMFLGQIDYNL